MIPREIVGADPDAYLRVLKEELPMFASDGRMPPDGARKEWGVLGEFNPKFKTVRVEDTYTNQFVDGALHGSAAR